MRVPARFCLSFGPVALGAVAWLACWTVVGMPYVLVRLPEGGWWTFLAVLLFLALFLLLALAAAWLLVQVLDWRRRAVPSRSTRVAGAVLGGVTLAATAVAWTTSAVVGHQLYHERYGQRVDAIITEAEPILNNNRNRTGTRYHLVDHHTERDLGWMDRGPGERADAGERIEVSLDPRGRVSPVAVDRLGWTTVPKGVLAGCFGAVALAAAVVVATGARDAAHWSRG
ncbi:hypothetical protein [Streptomyces hainanensis]|uniref:DUF3592 domain-containing protein n=1 Tax=Streptomyces hainanensis TaxID=402648 RepID=A0A4R4SW03_9ACTN|nr:hypothetical protein [Streptomyces hainanensis]TDC67024.1 hypothetical protein E1283_29230 [Streptomyces hainanensis]